MVKIRFHRGHGAIFITNIWQETIQRSTEKGQKSGKNRHLPQIPQLIWPCYLGMVPFEIFEEMICSNINKKYPENGPECVSFDRVGLKTALDISLFKNNRLTVGIRGCLSSNFILKYLRVLKGSLG